MESTNRGKMNNQTERLAREGNGYMGTAEFTDKLKELQKNLDADDIDFRVGRAGIKGDMGWCTLLAYKDARVDQKRLDEVFGGRWSNSFTRDSQGVLQCEISIYNADLGQWVSRASNGVASQFESEKGEYSDAFKRAGFMWGIGRELYDFPDLFVKLHSDEFWVDEKDGKKPVVHTTYKFKPSGWIWKVDWDHINEQGYRTGLIHAKEKGSTKYRVTPTGLIPEHKSEKA